MVWSILQSKMELTIESIFKNTESSMTNESNIFFCKFNDNVNLKNPKKNIRLANLGIYYT